VLGDHLPDHVQEEAEHTVARHIPRLDQLRRLDQGP
jgi:hypothetical protein